jgi:hypothetical protein
MVQRYEVVGSVLNKWYQVRSHCLSWPDQSMQPATVSASRSGLPGRTWSLADNLMQQVTDTPMLNDSRNAVETDWEKDWIDIGGEG